MKRCWSSISGRSMRELIARRVREQQVYCASVRHDLSAERIRQLGAKGIILSGGPASVYEAGAPRCDPAIFDLGVPILGICYGMQLACEVLGGNVASAPAREYGRAVCRVLDRDELFLDTPDRMQVWMSHGDQVSTVSDDFVSPGPDRNVSVRRGPPPPPADLRPPVPPGGHPYPVRRRSWPTS